MDNAEAARVLHEAGSDIRLEAAIFHRTADMIRKHPDLMWPMVLSDDGNTITYATAGTLDPFGDMLPHTTMRSV